MEGPHENRGHLRSVNHKQNGNRRALMDIKNLVGVAPNRCVGKKRRLAHKNAVLPPRPMTRKHAATLANRSSSFDEEAKNKDEHSVKDHIIDVDVPIVEETQQMKECELTEEIVMENLLVESIVEIDSCDSNNSLAVAEYVEDIYEYYKRIESNGCVSPDYMSVQFDINEKMRSILVDWLIEVHYKFQLMDETLYLTVNIIDRFLSKQTVVRNKLQLVGVTALLIACKYEEVSVPAVNDMIQITDRAYTKEEVLAMEKLMLKILKFDMSAPTAYVFMRRFLKAAGADRKLELLAYYNIDLCLLEYKMLKYKPSMLAASAIFTAQCSLKGFKVWSKTSEVYTGYTEDQLMECSKMMVDLHRMSATGKLTAVHKKFSTLKFGWAAKCKPALFLLDGDDDSTMNL